jgi:hypothetical protein
MRLYQNQIWQTPGEFIRIVKVDRLSVTYKTMIDLTLRTGPHDTVTKKEFCRMLKVRQAVLASAVAPTA